jgi:hypothetical protein
MEIEQQHQGDKTLRLRWRLSSLMIAIVAISVALMLVRPLATPAPVRAARAILEKNLPNPKFRPQDYQADSVQKTPSGYLRVRFVRIAGNGPAEQFVQVSARSVAQARLNPWWAPRR